MKIEISYYPLACDLSRTGIFKLDKTDGMFNGKYTYSDDYKLKVSRKNPATGEKLQNKGKPAKPPRTPAWAPDHSSRCDDSACSSTRCS